jgi:mono/diheme cytochrome c family protein
MGRTANEEIVPLAEQLRSLGVLFAMALRIRLSSLMAVAGMAALAFGPLAGLFIYFGVYNIAATSPHARPVYWLVETMAIRSIKSRARSIAVPDLSEPSIEFRGLSLFKEHCVFCHGAPGVARMDFAKGLEPGAPPLAQRGREWAPQELYWAIREGVKMTGMPAWKYRLPDSDLWALVAFLRRLPLLSPAEYQRMAGNAPETGLQVVNRPEQLRGHSPDADRGKIAFHQYACHMCHQVPGISGPETHVGPPLQGLAERRYIAGVLENSPENMMRWIQHPQQIKPYSAMPDMKVSPADAREIVAFLYTLD